MFDLTDFWTFFRGVGFGILVILLVEAIIVYKIILQLTIPGKRILPPSQGDRTTNRTIEEEMQDEHPEHASPWPEVVTERIKRWLQPTKDDTQVKEQEFDSMSKTQECPWLNLVLNRMFLSLRSSQIFRKMWTAKVF